MNKYKGSFDSREHMARLFEYTAKEPCACGSYDCCEARSGVRSDFPVEEDILYANYDGGGYDGEAFVVFLKNGRPYEVHASHCSCYGLEGQWEPEQTTWEALALQIANGGYARWDGFREIVREYCPKVEVEL